MRNNYCIKILGSYNVSISSYSTFYPNSLRKLNPLGFSWAKLCPLPATGHLLMILIS